MSLSIFVVITRINLKQITHKPYTDSQSGKLLKRMWTMRIKDKKLISAISAMSKAEAAGIGFPEKGTPQGGLSLQFSKGSNPLL